MNGVSVSIMLFLNVLAEGVEEDEIYSTLLNDLLGN